MGLKARPTTEVPAGQPLRFTGNRPIHDNCSQNLDCWTSFPRPPFASTMSMILRLQLTTWVIPTEWCFRSTDEIISNVMWDVLLYQELGKLINLQGQQQFYQAHMSGDKAIKQSSYGGIVKRHAILPCGGNHLFAGTCSSGIAPCDDGSTLSSSCRTSSLGNEVVFC